MIEAVQSFRTADGKLFASREEAECHEAGCELSALVENECWNSMDEEDVMYFLTNNRQKLIELLKASK